VPVRDVGALADAMQRLAGDAALRARMGAASRARVEARYAVERVNLQMLEALGVGG
jgi:glycosyltransferase involved in cell wall biosynthesis